MDKILSRWRDARSDQYKEQISSEWNFDGIKAECLDYVREEDGEKRAECYIGSVLSIMPSGKCYMPWTTNQTRLDVEKDSLFNEAMEEIFEAHGLYLTSSDGDGLDMVAGLIDVPDDAEIMEE